MFNRIEADLPNFTPAERRIAQLMLEVRQQLGFESAESLAAKLDVSKVTVLRFVRRLGYDNFKALKADLRAETTGLPWLGGAELTAFIEAAREPDGMAGALAKEIEALGAVYRLTSQQGWSDIVSLLAQSQNVYVTGFHAYAALLADFLSYARPGVTHLVPGGRGTVDALSGPANCLVFVDTRRYGRPTYALAKLAAEAGTPLIVIADRYCDWALVLTRHVVTVAVDAGQLLDSPLALFAVMNLLTNSLAAAIGAKVVRTRLALIAGTNAQTIGYV